MVDRLAVSRTLLESRFDGLDEKTKDAGFSLVFWSKFWEERLHWVVFFCSMMMCMIFYFLLGLAAFCGYTGHLHTDTQTYLWGAFFGLHHTALDLATAIIRSEI